MAKVLITGTSKGIGYQTALQLARSGYDVIATMRNPGGSDLATVAEGESLPVTVRQLDVDDDQSVNEVFAEFGDIDILVNNAGILSCETVEDEALEKFRAVMETNFFGAVKCCKAVVHWRLHTANGRSVSERSPENSGVAALHSNNRAIDG